MQEKQYFYAERALYLFESGFNCAQSVYAAFAPLCSVDEKEAMRLAAPFGGGFGRMRQVCGAFSGMMLVVGHFFGYDDVCLDTKKELYPRVQNLGERFRERLGSLLCRDLLGGTAPIGGVASERTQEYYKTRPCARVVYEAACILEDYLKEEGKA